MNRNELYEYLNMEYTADFAGWNFSYLNGRMQEDSLPWSYPALIKKYLVGKEALLDIDTGGGEFLDSLNGLPPTTYATEGYAPNIPIATRRLHAKGVTVKPVQDYTAFPFEDRFFDIIINRHGSYHIPEIKRLLKSGGVFITQQVGGLNAIDLNVALGTHPMSCGDWCLVKSIHDVKQSGMSLVESGEHVGKYRFYDIGAVVYYLRCIPWQIENFAIERYFDRLEILYELIAKKSFIDFIAHRFYLIVAN